MCISELKLVLQQKTGARFVLFYENEELNDSVTLGEAGIEDAGMVKAISSDVGYSESFEVQVSEALTDLSRYAVPDVGRINITN